MDKAVRKLFAQAKNGQIKRQKEQQRMDRLERGGQRFCPGCYAVLLEDKCPSCTLGLQEWDRWCRNCLRVHKASVTQCKPWKPES